MYIYICNTLLNYPPRGRRYPVGARLAPNPPGHHPRGTAWAFVFSDSVFS